MNVDTGQGNGTGDFIAANLNASDLIYTSPTSSFAGATINETIPRTYPQPIGTIEVNQLNVTTTYTSSTINQTSSVSYYWRQTTGMLTEFSVYECLIQGNMSWADVHLVIASVSVIPEFPTALVLPLFMIVTIAAVWLGKAILSTKKLARKTSPYG